MNPYDFVPIDWEHPPQRRPLVGHDNLKGLHGKISCRIIAETPIFLPDSLEQDKSGDSDLPKKFLQDSDGRYIIQGSSLKGLLRSITETVGSGCWVLFDGKYEGNNVNHTKRLPEEFSKCDSPNRLCPACLLFGVVNGDKVHYRGRVAVGDALCVEVVPHDPIYTIVLSNPKPRHSAWYVVRDKVAGRKYYFHQKEISTLSEQRTSATGTKLNQYITPLSAGSTFAFKVDF